VDTPNHNKGLRSVAIVEAFKDIIVLVAGLGLLTILGQNAGKLADQLVKQTHLNPASHYPRISIETMSHLADGHLRWLAALATIYAIVRLVEAYGLWNQRRWAEWLAALGGMIYIPLEIYELFQRVSLISVSALLINLGIVSYLVWVLQESGSQNSSTSEKT